MKLRALERADWPAVLALNQDSVDELSDLAGERLGYVLSLASRALVAEADAHVVAFALAMAPGTTYDSRNYRWFSQRFERFLYLDRIAVDVHSRRSGIGARLYAEMEAAARAFGRMVCEVNIAPSNDASLAFHVARGYREIARLEHGEKVVALMCKELAGGSADL
jgi:predicted GNAT superfamily acetyltransferase